MVDTKSRYEVIAELETKKRDLIKERDGLDDLQKAKEKEIRDVERQKDDTIVCLDRKITDMKESLETFKTTKEDKKTTIKELIVSMDSSLDRFRALQK